MPAAPLKHSLWCRKRGTLHLLLLLIIALAIVIAVPLLIKTGVVTTENGKIAFNFPPKSKVLAETTQSVVYQPQEAGEPAFSIDPPSGWADSEKDHPYQKFFYEAPEKDEARSGTSHLESAASVQIALVKNSAASLEDSANVFKSELSAPDIKATITKEKKTKLAGNDAMYLELTVTSPTLGTQLQNAAARQGRKLTSKDVEKFVNLFSAKAITYIIFKNGYTVQITGTGLTSTWDKRAPQIQSAISTFKFLGDENSPSPSPTPSPTATAIPTPTPSSLAANFDFKPPAGWKKTASSASNSAGKSNSISYQSPSDTHTFISIAVIPSPDKTYDKIIRDFKYDQAFHKARITRKNINGLEGWGATYLSTGAPSITYHNYDFKSYKNGDEITIIVRAPEKNWSNTEIIINKAIDSFKLVN